VPIRYTDTLDGIEADRLTGFFVGWPAHPDPERHLEILRGSHAVWLALDGDRVVGFINAISDGVYAAFIPLLEVLPEYQGRGTGRELAERMLQTLENMYAVDIVCDDAVAPFYEKLGLSRCTAMVRRNYDRQ
jgi:GNAT superfamily N-acetyltransferase